MAEPTDIEKKSLEAHVELCAERYRHLDEKLVTLETTLQRVSVEISSVKSLVSTFSEKRNTQLINWGLGIIAALGSVIGYLVTHFVLK